MIEQTNLNLYTTFYKTLFFQYTQKFVLKLVIRQYSYMRQVILKFSKKLRKQKSYFFTLKS